MSLLSQEGYEMKTRFHRFWVASAVASLALVLAACGSSGSSSASGSGTGSGAVSGAGTANLSVGTTTVHLPKGHLRVGIFISGAGTQWNKVLSAGALAEAKADGYTATIVSPNFDLTTQLNQAQTAANNHSYDAVVIEPIASAQECTAFSKILPAANVLVVDAVTPLCGHTQDTGDSLWSAGTMSFVGGEATISYVRAFLNDAAKLNPGKQQVVFVTGPQLDPLTVEDNQALTEFEATHPGFHVKSLIYTDWTTPTAYNDTLTYLRANPSTTLVLSAYSPDVSTGVVDALRQLGEVGKIKVDDEGGTRYSVQEIKAGAIQMSLPYFPGLVGQMAVHVIHEAQLGQQVPRFVSDIPSSYGTVDNPVVITKSNVDTYTPSY